MDSRAGAGSVRTYGSYQKEAGADQLPAEPPVQVGPLACHLLDVITELLDT